MINIRHLRSNYRLSAALLLTLPVTAFAQSPYNTAPASPCPEVLIEQKYDHVGTARYVEQGWDTVVTCDTRTLNLSAHPYVPVQYFNGTYLVERIPYNPPDTSFCMAGAPPSRRRNLPNNADDRFCASPVTLPNDFYFYFFGIRKTQFVAAGNGLLTFNTSSAGSFCDFQVCAPIPWNSSTSGNIPSPIDYYRDAIYGVYQDTDPSGNMSGDQGIWYGILDDFPCRKLICSYNELPWYPNSSNTSNRQSYQIVCYEGSNIIEVHIKRRRRGLTDCDWCNWGLIGIQNATGLPQVRNEDHSASNGNVVDGSPAAFWPVLPNGQTCNCLSNQQLDTIAFRYTPKGSTQKSMAWYRLFDNGDSIQLTTNSRDTNGYCSLSYDDPAASEYPTLQAWVSPTVPTRYMLSIHFYNAGGQAYYLHDTIYVGVDTSKTLRIDAINGDRSAEGAHVFDVCQGSTTECPLRYTSIQTPREVNWTIKRRFNGVDYDMPDGMLRFSDDNTSVSILPDPMADTMPTNKIDSIYLLSQVTFTSGCNNYDSLLVRIFPNFDITETYGICKGDDFTWHVDGQQYYESTTQPFVNLGSGPGCDSIVRLNLTVFDVSRTVDHQSDCKPYTWRNGVTYTHSNTATYATDIIRDTNRYGCDSIIQLEFTMHPLTARIKSSLEYFDYDNLNVDLTDISIGNESRRWLLPDGTQSNEQYTNYTLPAERDSADIYLIAYSPYGCIDTATIVIPFNRETMWLPNIFTPDDDNGNNLFGSTSINTLEQEMYIFNRQGQMVYHCSGVDCKWDGRRDDGTPCPQGAYVYTIRYTDIFQPKVIKTRKGTVTLIR